MHPVDFLKALIRIPSVSRNEKPIADYLEAFLKNRNIAVKRYEDNLVFGWGAGPHTLLLASHLDTVPPPENAPYPPFEAVEINGRIYGRGSVDAKGCVAAMTWALLELIEENYTPPGGRIEVALTVGEEIGGAHNGMAQLAKEHLQPDAALIGEPTSLQPCVAQKGLLILKAVTHGTAGHAARTAGDTAITKAARDILALQQLTFTEADPWVGLPKVTVTEISASGGSRNVVPSTCTYWLDVRSTPAYPHQKLIEHLQSVVTATLHVHSERLVPVHTPVSHPIVQACLKACPGSKPFGSPTLSDWVFLANVPAVKIGPGDSEFSHRDDEHISRDEFMKGIQVYKRIIQHYFDMKPS